MLLFIYNECKFCSAICLCYFSDDKSTNVGIIIGAVMGCVIVVVVLTAMLLKLIFVTRKKGKSQPMRETVLKPVLQTRNSEASLRYIRHVLQLV